MTDTENQEQTAETQEQPQQPAASTSNRRSRKKQTAEQPAKSTLAVKNIARNRFTHAGIDVAPGESVELPDHVLNNEKSLRIIDRQVAIGRMEYVG